MYREQDIKKREQFHACLEKIDKNLIIHVDETGMDDNDGMSYGYAPVGMRCYAQKTGRAKKRISLIAGLQQGKIIAPMTFEGTCDRFVFEAWLEKILVPEIPKGSVLVLDNASFHKGGNIKQILQNAGASLLYLAPYSPEDNPIEHHWSPIKNIARRYNEDFYLFHDAFDEAIRQYQMN